MAIFSSSSFCKAFHSRRTFFKASLKDFSLFGYLVCSFLSINKKYPQKYGIAFDWKKIKPFSHSAKLCSCKLSIRAKKSEKKNQYDCLLCAKIQWFFAA